MNVSEKIGTPALLEQCAEECNELAHACLKMARKLRNENPTPAKEEDILNSLVEEIANIWVCIGEIVNSDIVSYDAVDSVVMQKRQRWENRIAEKENN